MLRQATLSRSRYLPVLKIWRGNEAHPLTGLRVGEGQLGGVQLELPRAGASAVEWITDDWDTEPFRVGGVQAELVRPPGDGDELDTGYGVLDRNFPPVCGAHFPVNFVVDLKWAVVHVQPERQGDGAIFTREHPV